MPLDSLIQSISQIRIFLDENIFIEIVIKRNEGRSFKFLSRFFDFA